MYWENKDKIILSLLILIILAMVWLGVNVADIKELVDWWVIGA